MKVITHMSFEQFKSWVLPNDAKISVIVETKTEPNGTDVEKLLKKLRGSSNGNLYDKLMDERQNERLR